LKSKKGATKLEKEDLEAASRVKEVLEMGTDIRSIEDWTVKEVDFINRTQFITAKPVVYLVNMSEKDFLRKKNKHLPKVMEYVKSHGGDPVIPYSAAFEQRIFDLPDDEKEQVHCSSLNWLQGVRAATEEHVAQSPYHAGMQGGWRHQHGG
jgi:obg-like ATPase 1